MPKLLKNVVALGGLALIAFVGYYLIGMNRDATVAGNNTLVVSQAEAETKDFLARLDDLNTIQLSTDIFSDPRFTSLQDFTGPVERVPYGRSNPFIDR
jgi:hypothetical protein